MCYCAVLAFFHPFLTALFQAPSSREQWLEPSPQLNVPLVDIDKVYLCFQLPVFLVVTCCTVG